MIIYQSGRKKVQHWFNGIGGEKVTAARQKSGVEVASAIRMEKVSFYTIQVEHLSFGKKNKGEENCFLLNVYHHAPVPNMRRAVSSGNLAIEFVHSQGVVPGGVVVINHCDCDSIISAAILSGRVEPSDKLADAVIAADHTGEANLIADVLQPLESLRDLEMSLAVLSQLISGQPLNQHVRDLHEERLAERRKWQIAVSQPDAVSWIGSVALLESAQRISAELL